MDAMSTWSLKQEPDSLTECPLCHEDLVDPRSLPCVHTFCLRCIHDNCKDYLPGQSAPCPICRHEFVVPDGGVDGLTKNFFIEKVTRIKELISIKSKHNRCEACQKLANVYCSDCEQNLCNACNNLHKSLAVSKDHNSIMLGEKGQPVEIYTRFQLPTTCDEHRGKQLEYYCAECSQLACINCFVEHHQAHNCSRVEAEAEKCRNQMAIDVAELTGGAEAFRPMQQTITRSKFELVQLYETAVREVEETAERLRQKIEVDRQNLLDELTSIRERRMKQIEAIGSQVKQHPKMIHGLRRYSDELSTKGSSTDVVRYSPAIHDRVGQLLEPGHFQRTVDELGAIELKLSASEMVTSIDAGPNVNVIGSIVHRVLLEDPLPNPTPTMVHILPRGSTVRGVTVLGEQLCVARNGLRHHIETYHVDTFQLCRQITVPELKAVSGLTSCPANRCLYVSDCDNKSVHRIQLPANGNTGIESNTYQFARWQVDGGPIGLSVNASHNLLVTCCFSPYRLKEYTTSGTQLREIRLQQSEICRPWHAIQLPSGQYLISHGVGAETLHRVCVVGPGGFLVESRCFGGKAGSGAWLLNGPAHLAVRRGAAGSDRASDVFVLVADKDNGRVVLLDAELRRSSDLSLPLDGGSLLGPRALYLDETRDRLYIGEWKGGRVLVIGNISAGLNFN